MEYHIWCDESDKYGKRFSNFYGGALVASEHMAEVIEELQSAKLELNLYGEIKWSKVSENYLNKYIQIMLVFFRLMREGKIRTRVMFTQEIIRPVGLSREQVENGFFLLYYQFIKHAFGLIRCPYHPERSSLHIYFDKLPDKKGKAVDFKSNIYRLNNFINDKNIYLPFDNISEVVSHEHVVLQCVDVVTGAMSFRLNHKHKVTPPGRRVRGRKTRAKETLYKAINRMIQDLYCDYQFNVGSNTGWLEGEKSLWSMPYRHWRFVPKQHKIISEK